MTEIPVFLLWPTSVDDNPNVAEQKKRRGKSKLRKESNSTESSIARKSKLKIMPWKFRSSFWKKSRWGYSHQERLPPMLGNEVRKGWWLLFLFLIELWKIHQYAKAGHNTPFFFKLHLFLCLFVYLFMCGGGWSGGVRRPLPQCEDQTTCRSLVLSWIPRIELSSSALALPAEPSNSPDMLYFSLLLSTPLAF